MDNHKIGETEIEQVRRFSGQRAEALSLAHERIGDMERAIGEALRQLESLGGTGGRNVDAAIEALRAALPR